jgi:hypothetical protein
VLCKYIISDRPMTEEEWTKERATLIDVTPDDEKTAGRFDFTFTPKLEGFFSKFARSACVTSE